MKLGRNYFFVITWYRDGLVTRVIQSQLRGVTVTDNVSLRECIDRQLDIEGFQVSEWQRQGYVVTVLCDLGPVG